MNYSSDETLILKWKINSENGKDYIVEIYSNENEFISKIDFKNDINFNNINIVNDRIIKNIRKYDVLKIIKHDKHTEDTILKDEIWENIFNDLTTLWISEFNTIKTDFKNIKITKFK